jgi:hypothetical protein
LTIDGKVEGNDVNADGKSLVVITGANQAGNQRSCVASAWRN